MIETRTYEVVTKHGQFRIDVPATARVSYGPIIGANGKGTASTSNALRVWEGTKATEVQRLLVQDVVAFRDLSIPMKVRAFRKFGAHEDDWYATPGTWKRGEYHQDWVDADKVKSHQPELDDFEEASEDYSAYSTSPVIRKNR